MSKPNKEKILYVDDEPENLEVFDYTFMKYYDIYLAGSAKEGMEILKREPIKLVLTDQRMPHITGVEFLANAAELYPRIVRMIVTGFSDVEAIIEAINKGRVYRYITKPWNRDELKMVIDNALEAYNLKEENQKLIKNLKATNTKLEEANKVLKEAKDAAEQADSLKTSFLANMSHEIRTPLNGILGFSNLLTYPDLEDEQRAEFVNLIEENGKYLLNIIDDIVDISKIESNQIEIKPHSFSINELLQELSSFYNNERSLIQKPSLNLVPEYPDEDLMLYTDRDRLKQVLNNFISNAIKFTTEGIIKYGYEIQDSESEKSFVKFYVSDTGMGIPKEKYKFIFERFKKIDYEKKVYRGNGLGLTISENLAKLMGGEIYLKSEVGAGSTFFLKLPLVTGESGKFTKKEDLVPKTKYNWEGKTILIADDDEVSNELLSHILKKTKVNIITALDGAEALEKFESQPDLDLVLLDIQMPKINGYELSKRFKSKNENIVIITQTAFAMTDDCEKSLQSGADSYFSKPVNINVLMEKIEDYFSR